jgi:hypothetical protein
MSPEDKKKLELIRLKKAIQSQLDECFDPNDLQSRPKGLQLECLKDEEHSIMFVVAPNRSGKSQAGSRHISWWFQNKHPYIPKRDKWGEGGFNILVVGRTTSIMEQELWEQKIKKFLPPGSYREKRGATLEYVEHLETKNRIIFKSHHDSVNATGKVQGFTTPVVWLDEMPSDPSLLTELMLRTSTNDGVFIATFTPLVENEEIKRIVDAPTSSKKKYVFRVEDNPQIASDLDKYEENLKAMCATEAEYRARRWGEWFYKSGRVIKAYHPEKHKHPLPSSYSTGWKHVAVVDPAASGLVGLTVFCQDPGNSVWWNVMAKTLDGDAAYSLVKSVEKEIAGLNIVKRVCDCNPSGFYKEARRQGINYKPVEYKQDRKNDMIEATNTAFVEGKIMLSKEHSTSLEEECLGCKWSPTDNNKILHSSKWHLLDTLRYFIDNMPPLDKIEMVYDNDRHAVKQAFRDKQEKRQQAAAKKTRMRIMKRNSKFRSAR